MTPAQIRMYLKIAAALIVMSALGAFGVHERQVEHAKDTAAAQAAVEHQQVKDRAQAAADSIVINEEARTYAKSVATAVSGAPVVSLCVDPPRPVLPAAQAAARPIPHGAPDLRGADAPVPAVLRWDTEPVVQIAHDADAQVIALQDYIQRVCPVR